MFSKEEVKDIIISMLALTVIFSYPFFGLFHLFFIALVISFLFHELAHKFVARHFGCTAFYQMWLQGLLFGFLLMFTGIKFVAPGAVMIYPYSFGRWGYRAVHLGRREIGLIGLAGPLVNIVFALLFLTIPGNFSSFLLSINAWLAFFNLIPFPPLDGSKVFAWDWRIWLAMVGVSGILFFFM